MTYFYLARYTITDGAHHYQLMATFAAPDEKTAQKRAELHEHEAVAVEEDTDVHTLWDFGDGETTATLDSIELLSEDEATVLDRLGASYIYV